ncbi:MAG: chemotaxis protein [Bradyrhizobium sp.]
MAVGGEVGTIGMAIASIEEVSSRIEGSFAQAGHELGRGHAIFQDLSQALAALSAEFSGAQIEGASQAIHDIADRLNGLAAALPTQSVLLGQLGQATAEASNLLGPLFKHIQMLSIVARSARIEAASLAEDRENFLAFTQEAFELAKEVQQSLEGCARDQELLSKAIGTALVQQKDFDQRYRGQLHAAGGELITAYSDLRQQRKKGIDLAGLAGSNTRRMAEAVGRSIVSLQAGDSTRQRLEHVCVGLRLVSDTAASLAPGSDASGMASFDADLMSGLQAAQLRDTQREFERDIVEIAQSLSAILVDATGMVCQGQSLYGGKGSDSSSFLTRIREMLAKASALITTCEAAGKCVDEALSLVEDTLGRFRDALTGLSEAVVDITLIGMNASLKAAHLGRKGNAFVVIANELKLTAEQVSGGAGRLTPILETIKDAAKDIRELRVHSDPAHLVKLEPAILGALREIEAGNGCLSKLIGRLVEEGTEFERLIKSARGLMMQLGEGAATLPEVVRLMDPPNATIVAPGEADEAALNDIFARYTMERERDVHREFLRSFGLKPEAPAAVTGPTDAEDGVLLF